MKKILLSLLFLILTGCYSDNNKTNQEDTTETRYISNLNLPDLDTSHWITVPIGRYLIKLPPSAKITWLPLTFKSQYKLVLKKDMTLEEGRKLLTIEAEKAKNTPHTLYPHGSLGFYQEEFGELDENGKAMGTLLGTHPNKFSKTFLYKMYFESKTHSYNDKLEKKLFYYEEEVLVSKDDKFAEINREFFKFMQSNVYINDPSLPLTTVPSTYFKDGILMGPLSKDMRWRTEGIGVEIEFPEYPGIVLDLRLSHRRNPGFMLGKFNTLLDNRHSYEYIETFIPKWSKVTHYLFEVQTPSGKEEIFWNPYVRMTLENPTGGVMRDGKSTARPPITKPSFQSMEEAYAFWIELKKGFRWRPDGVHVPLPEEANGKPYFIVNDKIIPAE